MPGELVPLPSTSDAAAERTTFSPPGWSGGAGPAAAPSSPAVRGSRLARYRAAIGRYKWVMLPIVLLATLAGIVATRFIRPDYEAQARIWMSADDDVSKGNG